MAARTTAYEGEQVVASWRSTGTQTLTLDVSHQPGVGTVVAVPGAPTAGSGSGGSGGSVSSAVMQADTDIFDPSGSVRLLLQHYVCTDAGGGQVAGRATSVVDVRRPGTDGAPTGPIVARFWLDDRTGLLLRREVYDASGRIVGTSRFATLTMTSPGTTPSSPTVPAALLPAVSAAAAASATPPAASPATPPAAASSGPASPSPSRLPTGWTEVMTATQLARLRGEGWQLPAQLDGLTLYDARIGEGPDADHDGDDAVLQLGYSDGVSNVSLFEQAGRLDPASVADWSTETVDGYPVYERDMLSTRMIWSGEGMVYTLVADAAPDVVGGVVAALPHGTPGAAMVTRAHRGVDRVGSWLDPFH
jgi:sigma-E factor negative regulatory protein RseB